MNVTVDADGRVRRDRGRARLGLDGARPAARSRSSRAAAPFGRFNAAMRKQADQLVITSRFRFTRDETARDDAERQHEH